ncbi:MAG TPA: hypothetical protein VFV69_01580 [Steroidobacteraceae bacterium]|jgi:hypothetical protein|nr:hypothetical protein [Steroidobacteraceae bacterium]
MAARHSSRACTVFLVGVALLAAGVLIGRTSISASARPTVHLMPFPVECEAAWKDMKLSIESGTGAKVSFSRFDESVPQYPNLAGIVRIDGVDKVAASALRPYLDTVMARCYADSSTGIPLSNPEFARLLQLTLVDLRKQTQLPLYLTLDGEQIAVHFNQPLPN